MKNITPLKVLSVLMLILLTACGSEQANEPEPVAQPAPVIIPTPAPAPTPIPPSSNITVTDPAARGVYGVGTTTTVIRNHTSNEGVKIDLQVTIWYPTSKDTGAPADTGKFPLIIFSHGASSAPNASSFLTEHLASHGFVVAAAQHPKAEQDKRGEAFSNRPAEVYAVVDYVIAQASTDGALLEGLIDDDRLGITGHSFGGLTTIALLGRADNRFKAGMPMAPGIRPFDEADVSDSITKVTVPIMFMMSGKDTLALYSNLSAAYATIPSSTQKYSLIFPNGTHLSYSNTCSSMCPPANTITQEAGHQLINTIGTAFFQVYLYERYDYEYYLYPNDDLANGEARVVKGDIP